MFTIYFVDVKRRIPALLFYIMAIGCREDSSVGLAMLGAYFLLSGYRPRVGILMAVTSAIYFAVMRFGIMPRFGPGWVSDIYKDLYPRPDGPQTKLSLEGPSPEEQLVDRQLRHIISNIVGQLDPSLRDVLLRRDVLGADARTAAEALGIGVQALKSRLHRARAEVKRQLLANLRDRTTGSSAPRSIARTL